MTVTKSGKYYWKIALESILLANTNTNSDSDSINTSINALGILDQPGVDKEIGNFEVMR